LTYHHDTYDRRIQLGASRRRYEDAIALHSSDRWNGAIYLAGYAIECSLKSLICYSERKDNLKETRLFDENVPAIAECIQQIDIPTRGELYLVPAGEYDEGYIHRLADLDIRLLYQREKNPIHQLLDDVKAYHD